MNLTELYPQVLVQQHHLYLLRCSILSLFIVVVSRKHAHQHLRTLSRQLCFLPGKSWTSAPIVLYSYLHRCSNEYESGAPARASAAANVLANKREITRAKRGSSRRYVQGRPEKAKRLERREEAQMIGKLPRV